MPFIRSVIAAFVGKVLAAAFLAAAAALSAGPDKWVVWLLPYVPSGVTAAEFRGGLAGIATASIAWLLLSLRHHILSPRVEPIAVYRQSTKDAQAWRIVLENSSGAACERLLCRLVGIEAPDGDESFQAWEASAVDLPLVLVTQEQRRHMVASGGPMQRRRWRLETEEKKNIELLHIRSNGQEFSVPHQSGDAALSCRSLVLRIEITGDTPPRRFAIWVFSSGQRHIVMLARSFADNLALQQLSEADLFDSKKRSRVGARAMRG